MEIIWGTDSQLTPHPVLCCPSPSTVCPIQSNCDAGNLVSLPVRAGDIVHLVRHIRSLDAGIRAFGFDEAFRRTVGVPLVRGAGVGAGGLSHFITGDTSVECLITVPFPHRILSVQDGFGFPRPESASSRPPSRRYQQPLTWRKGR